MVSLRVWPLILAIFCGQSLLAATCTDKDLSRALTQADTAKYTGPRTFTDKKDTRTGKTSLFYGPIVGRRFQHPAAI